MSSSASSIHVTLFFQFHLIGSEPLKNICRSDMFVIVLLFDHHDQVFKGLIKGPKQLPDNQVICDVWSTEGNQLSGESSESIVCGLNLFSILAGKPIEFASKGVDAGILKHLQQ